MRLKLYTLVDITETGARRGEEPTLVSQQQNFLTVLQTIGLRANPSYEYSPSVESMSPNKVELGTNYKGKHKVWEFSFDIEYGEIDIETLNDDFNFIPVIAGLDETAKFEDNIFSTKDTSKRNIVFQVLDK